MNHLFLFRRRRLWRFFKIFWTKLPAGGVRLAMLSADITAAAGGRRRPAVFPAHPLQQLQGPVRRLQASRHSVIHVWIYHTCIMYHVSYLKRDSFWQNIPIFGIFVQQFLSFKSGFGGPAQLPTTGC